MKGYKLTNIEASILELVADFTKIDTWFSLVQAEKNLYFVYDLETQEICDFQEAVENFDSGIDWEIVGQKLSSEEFVIFNNLINRIIYL